MTVKCSQCGKFVGDFKDCITCAVLSIEDIHCNKCHLKYKIKTEE